jgi:inorganic pyrophosphatase
MEVVVVIETPARSRNKYELDPATGEVWLDRTLLTATHYPADYGSVIGSVAGDGDPLDALVLVDEPTFPGCHVRARPVAVFRMSDEGGQDDKVVCVPAGDPRWAEVHDLEDLPALRRQEIEHFFDVYKELEVGKGTTIIGWEGAAAACNTVTQAMLLSSEHGRS